MGGDRIVDGIEEKGCGVRVDKLRGFGVERVSEGWWKWVK